MAKKKAKAAVNKPAANKSAETEPRAEGKPPAFQVRKKKGPNDPAKTRAWQIPFLRLLRKHNQLALAAETVGVSRITVWVHAKRDKKFRLEISEARRLFREDHVAKLEGELLRRALVTDHKKKDTRALLTALRRFDPEHYDRPKNQNVNLGGQPGNQLPAPTVENRISVVRIIDINSHADAEIFRRMQRERQQVDEVIDETPPPSIENHGQGNGKPANGKPATNGQANGKSNGKAH